MEFPVSTPVKPPDRRRPPPWGPKTGALEELSARMRRLVRVSGLPEIGGPTTMLHDST